VAVLFLAATVSGAHAATINFEDHAVSPGTAMPLTGDPASGGFGFDTLGDIFQWANASTSDNGSTYLVLENLGGENRTTLSAVDGAPFALLSMDLSEWQTEQSSARQVAVTGNLFGGGTVSTLLTLNGDFNENVLANYFQTFTFDTAWGNLASVVLVGTGSTFNGGTGNYFGIDNIEVGAATQVPEPGTLSLFGIGSAILAGRRRRKAR
jgi:hypothetical protein